MDRKAEDPKITEIVNKMMQGAESWWKIFYGENKEKIHELMNNQGTVESIGTQFIRTAIDVGLVELDQMNQYDIGRACLVAICNFVYGKLVDLGGTPVEPSFRTKEEVDQLHTEKKSPEENR